MNNAQGVQANVLIHMVTLQNHRTLRSGRKSIHFKKGLHAFYTFVQVFNQDIGHCMTEFSGIILGILEQELNSKAVTVRTCVHGCCFACRRM